MRMEDVKVGMRLRSTMRNIPEDITVTELTDRGFKYSLDEEKVIHPRLGLVCPKDGHEHFGFNGEAYYEPVDETASKTC